MHPVDSAQIQEKLSDSEFLKELTDYYKAKLTEVEYKSIRRKENDKQLKKYGSGNCNANLDSDKSIFLKIKWINDYEKKKNELEKWPKIEEINNSISHYDDSLSELIGYLEGVNYNEKSFEVLDKVENNYIKAKNILQATTPEYLNKILQFDREEFILLTGIKNQKKLIKAFNVISDEALKQFLSSPNKLAFLDELISGNVCTETIRDVGLRINKLDDLIPEHTNLLIKVINSNKNLDHVIWAKNNKNWLTFEVACLALIKSNNNDISEVFNLLKSIYDRVGYRPKEIKLFLEAVDNDSVLNTIRFKLNDCIFEEIKNEVGEVVKIKNGTLMNPKDKPPYTLNHDIKEEGNRFLGKKEGDFHIHLRKIDYLLKENYVTVTSLGWTQEKPGLLKNDFIVKRQNEEIMRFTMHKHPGVGPATVGSTVRWSALAAH